MKLEQIRSKIAERTNDQLLSDLDVVQEQIDAVLEAEERGDRDAGSDYKALCLLRREMVAAGIERGIIDTPEPNGGKPMKSYHVNVSTQYERDFYVEATSAEEAEQKIRQSALDDPKFWEKEDWDLMPEGRTDYYVEQA